MGCRGGQGRRGIRRPLRTQLPNSWQTVLCLPDLEVSVVATRHLANRVWVSRCITHWKSFRVSVPLRGSIPDAPSPWHRRSTRRTRAWINGRTNNLYGLGVLHVGFSWRVHRFACSPYQSLMFESMSAHTVFGDDRPCYSYVFKDGCDLLAPVIETSLPSLAWPSA